MEIVVKGRHTEVPERFRQHVQAKLAKLERLDPKAFRVDAELSHEPNPRLAGRCERIELTVYSRGPVIRAEAAAADCYAALDVAAGKLAERLRRAADRRVRRHTASHTHGRAKTKGVESAPPAPPVGIAGAPDRAGTAPADGDPVDRWQPADEGGPMVVREKTHEAVPMTLDDALHEMELVGHDFYLFLDRDSSLPSVVYRRKGYAYGVLRLCTADGESVLPPVVLAGLNGAKGAPAGTATRPH